jgi:NAD(P)H dehydrogenase (quinone)
MYVIAGVNGYVGDAAAQRILREVEPDQLIVTSRDAETLERWSNRGVDARRADFDDLEQTAQAFAGGDSLLLVSTMLVGPRRQQQHQNAIEAARRAGVGHIVYTSYLGTDNAENTALVADDHRLTEQAIFESGLTWNIMRNSQYADAVAEHVAAIGIGTGRSISNCGSGKLAFVARDDVARVGIALLRRKGEPDTAYDITGPELLDYEQVNALASEISGHPIETVDLSDSEMYAMWDAMGVPRASTDDSSRSPVPWCSDDMVSFGASIRHGHMAVINDNVERLTGERPLPLRAVMERYAPDWPTPAPSYGA